MDENIIHFNGWFMAGTICVIVIIVAACKFFSNVSKDMDEDSKRDSDIFD